MAFCSNKTNTSCCHGGQCVFNQCICATSCFLGDRCETFYNAIDLPFTSAMVEDTPMARIVYIIMITGLVVIGLANNIAGLMTFTRESIRITACGVYLIVFSSTSIVFMMCLQMNALTVAGYDTPSLRLWSCYTSPYVSLTIGFIGLWISVGIAIERVLIECFDMNLYRTRLHAVLVSIGFFVFSAISNLPVIFAREYATDSSDKPLCFYDYLSYPAWKRTDIIFSHIYIIIPCVAHLICLTCMLIVIAGRRNHRPLRQLYIHRDSLIPSVFIILCLLPTAIHGHLLHECLPYSSVEQRRFHIASIFLLYIPQALVYLLYREGFREISIRQKSPSSLSILLFVEE